MPTCRAGAPKKRKLSAYQEASSRGKVVADGAFLPYYTGGMDKEALAELDAIVACGLPPPREGMSGEYARRIRGPGARPREIRRGGGEREASAGKRACQDAAI